MQRRKRTKWGIAFAVLFVAMAFMSIGLASADTIYVPDNYPTIQQAVDNATDGDTIFVRTGTYPENIRIDSKDLTIEGENRDTTIIDGVGSGNCVHVRNAGVSVSKFTIKNAGNYGVYAHSSDLNINNATISNCGDNAIYFPNGKTLTLRDSILENCGGGLVYSDYSTAYAQGNATIERNIIRNSTGNRLYIYLYGPGDNVVINDNIITNNTRYSIKCDHYYSSNYIDSITMRNNTVKECGNDGIYIEGATDLNITGLIIENVGDDGVYARCSSNMTLKPPFGIKNAGGYGICAYGPEFSLNNATISNCGGNAIYFSNGKTLTLRDSILENCGGGLVYGATNPSAYAKGDATIERNIIRNNTDDGLLIKLGSGNSAVINDNMVINNTGSGSDGIYCYILGDGGLVTLQNNTVKNSGDKGICLYGAKYSTLVNNTISLNSAGMVSIYALLPAT